MKLGDTVRVSAESFGHDMGSVIAHVDDVRLPDELEDLPEPASLRSLAARELNGVTLTALLSYEEFPGKPRSFAALRSAGIWRDRAGTVLEIAAA
jgi:hypothetical protein